MKKKKYYKPIINIETFEMDIDILKGLTQADLDFFRMDFRRTYEDDLEGLSELEIEALWRQYAASELGKYDNYSSGLCYHSTGGLS